MSATTTDLARSRPPSPADLPVGAGARSAPAPPRRAWTGWGAVLAVAMFPAVEAARILIERPHVVLYGDQALLELGARRAAHFDQLVGPYSREGFHHPGPAVFYLLAPFVRLLEPAGPGLYLGAVVINAAALIAIVAVFWRRLGPLVALWAAAAIDLFCVCVGVATLREPWNPYLVVVPMVLFVVLWSSALSGSGGAGAWALVVGSYDVQTHIATAPVVVVMAVVLVVYMARHRPTRDGWTWAGLAALLVIWLPPVVELWRDRPNNLQALWNFFTSGHPTPPLGNALHISADAISIVPFGNHDYVLALNRSPWQIGVAAVLLAGGLAVAVHMRRRPLVGPLAASAVIGLVVGTLSLTLTDGPVYMYFAVWLAYVPLSLLLAIGAGMADRTWGGAGLRVVGAVLAVLTVVLDLGLGSVSATTGSGPWPSGNAGTTAGRHRTVYDTAALSEAAVRELGPGDRTVGLTIGAASLWPYAAGIVLELDEHGVQSTVGPAAWETYFGHERAPGRPVSMSLGLYLSGERPAGAAVIANVDGVELTKS
jgi:hypothetical protein